MVIKSLHDFMKRDVVAPERTIKMPIPAAPKKTGYTTRLVGEEFG
jgi:hypothetical protein